MRSDIDDRVNERAVECREVGYGQVNIVEITNKDDLLRISNTVQKPILRKGREYFILDTLQCYHFREER